jgi:hypothetical protein
VSSPATRVAVGRLSRSALFAASAAGLALVTTECGSTPQPLPPYGQPPGCCEVPPDDAAAEDAAGDAATGDASEASGDAADGGASTSDATAGDAGPTEGGSDGAVVPPTDASEAGG